MDKKRNEERRASVRKMLSMGVISVLLFSFCSCTTPPQTISRNSIPTASENPPTLPTSNISTETKNEDVEILLGDDFKLTIYEACNEILPLTLPETHLFATIDYANEYLYYLEGDAYTSRIIKQHLESGGKETVYSGSKEYTVGFVLVSDNEIVICNKIKEPEGEPDSYALADPMLLEVYYYYYINSITGEYMRLEEALGMEKLSGFSIPAIQYMNGKLYFSISFAGGGVKDYVGDFASKTHIEAKRIPGKTLYSTGSYYTSTQGATTSGKWVHFDETNAVQLFALEETPNKDLFFSSIILQDVLYLMVKNYDTKAITMYSIDLIKKEVLRDNQLEQAIFGLTDEPHIFASYWLGIGFGLQYGFDEETEYLEFFTQYSSDGTRGNSYYLDTKNGGRPNPRTFIIINDLCHYVQYDPRSGDYIYHTSSPIDFETDTENTAA